MTGAKEERIKKDAETVVDVGSNKTHMVLGIGSGLAVLIIVAIITHKRKRPPKLDLSVFDSPDRPGSGRCMDPTFIRLLQRLEKVTRLPIFKMINSGARSDYWNSKVGGVANSSHKMPKCQAADIKAPTLTIRNKIVVAAKLVGFKRIGVGNTFVHLDNDTTKTQYVAWGYPKGTPPPINPFV